MNVEAFQSLLRPVMDVVADRISTQGEVDAELEQKLMLDFPPDSAFFTRVEAACHEAIAEGWMCYEGEIGRRTGRVIDPAPETRDISVDVVDLADIRGPHHTHPKGEVLMIMPQDETARFDARGRGWLVYGPGTGHRPTVRGGQALVLYLLPGGELHWTDSDGY